MPRFSQVIEERPIDRQSVVDVRCGQALRAGTNGEASPAGVLPLNRKKTLGDRDGITSRRS